jgi:hypothetical protein
MTASNESVHEGHSTSGKAIALTLLLGFLALAGFTGIHGALKPGPELWTWPRLCSAAVGLLICAGALWGLSRQERSSLKSATLGVVLANFLILGIAGTRGVVSGLIASETLWGPWAWQTVAVFAKNLLILLVGIGGILWLKPWRSSRSPDEPVSPATRRTNMLFGVSGLLTIVGMVALIFGTKAQETAAFMHSGSSLSLGIALFAIATWLLAHAIGWWWYFSADEHERRANDVGCVAAAGLVMAVPPAWWVAARADLLPAPDAMIIWLLACVAYTIGWSWYRNR